MPPTKYDDESHRKLRNKLRKWRARNKAKLQQQSDRKRLTTGRKPQESKALWRLYERAEPRGDVGDVVLIHDAEPAPSGYAESAWLPSGLLPFHLARTIGATRRRQLKQWLAERPR